MRKIVGMFMLIILTCVIAAGCSSGVNENKTISEIKTEAQAMSVEQLKVIIAKYQKAIESKQTQIDAIKQQLQKIPLNQMLSEEAKKLKSDIENITSSIKALTARLNVYTQQLNSK